MEDSAIQVAATCVRIPVFSGHSESIYIETKQPAELTAVKEWIKSSSRSSSARRSKSADLSTSTDECR